MPLISYFEKIKDEFKIFFKNAKSAYEDAKN
jgi:hypothetical protein